MKKNNAGGFSFVLDNYNRLLRFLVLGTEGGTAYLSEKKHTKRACKSINELLSDDGLAVVDIIADVARNNRAIKNDESIYCLALCFAKGDIATRRAASKIFNFVIRTGTHMFQFMEFAKENKTSGRLLRQTVAQWYLRDPELVALQVLKYRQRNGWTHLDVLRLSHPNPGLVSAVHVDLCKFIVKGDVNDLPNLDICKSYYFVSRATTAKEVAHSIDTLPHVPREFIPTEFLKSREVWAALLKAGMPMTAMLRNLGVMTANGTITSTSRETLIPILNALNDAEVIKRSRVHPFSILLALDTYSRGSGVKGNLTWNPIGSVIGALNKALMLSFGNVESTGSRVKIGLDISGSMFMEGSCIAGTKISAGVVAAVIAKCIVLCEPFTEVMAFSDHLVDFPMSGQESLDELCIRMRRINMGGTDCALPIVDALQKQQVIDTFIVITDNETWHGRIHPMAALRQYRREVNRKAKMIVIGMTATEFSIADPEDSGCLDIVGFDASGPKIISGFMKGDF